MNPLSTLRARGLLRPHLLALAAALALPATVGAQATNNWRCAGGGWNGDPVCWSLGTPNSTQNVVIPAGPTGSDLMLLTAIGNNVSMRQLTVGAARTEPLSSATAFLYASGSTISVNTSAYVGVADNANAQLTLTNNSALFLGAVYVGTSSSGSSSVQPGIGTLTVQGNSRINGNVQVNNGRLDVAGGSDPGYVAINGTVNLGNSTASLGVTANIAGSVNNLILINARANIGMTGGNLAVPDFRSIEAGSSGVADFVGQSKVDTLVLRSGGVVNINRDASVKAPVLLILAGAKLTLQSGGLLNAMNPDGLALSNYEGGRIDLNGGGTIIHSGFSNAGTVSGTGLIGAALGTVPFRQASSGAVFANGGDLTIWGFDGSAGGTIGTQNGRLFFEADTVFKAGQVIMQSGSGRLIAFQNKVEIGNATQRGALAATVNDLAFSSSSNLFLDFGGATDHDYVATSGKMLVGGGTLTLRTAGSFQAGVNSVFDIFRATSGITGTFSSIDATAFAMAPGARLDFSNLYTTGTVAVVPEPATWLSLGAGLLLIGARARRWRQVA